MNPKFDAIIILGGGTRPNMTLPPWTKARVNKALEIAKKQGTKYFVLPTGASTHIPVPLTERGQPVTDSAVIAKHLMDAGITSEQILMLDFARDTLGEAFLTRILFADIRQLKTLCIVTSEFHLARAKHYWSNIFSLLPKTQDYELTFVGSENIGMSDKLLAARRVKETQRIQESIFNTRSFKTLAAVHEYFCHEHDAYVPFATPKQDSEEIRKSY